MGQGGRFIRGFVEAGAGMIGKFGMIRKCFRLNSLSAMTGVVMAIAVKPIRCRCSEKRLARRDIL